MTWSRETDPRLPGWLNTLLNIPPFLLPVEAFLPLLAIVIGDKVGGRWKLGRIGLGSVTGPVFWNGVLFVRVALPFLVAVQIRWSGSTTEKALLQLLLGWKPNGRFAVTCRVQSDATSAAGVLSPNTDQATGFDRGGH